MFRTFGGKLMPVDFQWFQTKLDAGVNLTKSEDDRVARKIKEKEEAEVNRNMDMITLQFAMLNYGVPLLIQG